LIGGGVNPYVGLTQVSLLWNLLSESSLERHNNSIRARFFFGLPLLQQMASEGSFV